jgi:molybdopterin/thiamine biosynthesis adenylyltransferase
MHGGKLSRIVCRESISPLPTDYLARTASKAELRPEFVAAIAQRARRSGESVILTHSHPRSFNEFSAIDDQGESVLAPFLASRIPNAIHGAMLVTPERTLARELGAKRYFDVAAVGNELDLEWSKSDTPSFFQYDRQIRAFGRDGQHLLQKLTVGIVGLGGTGSIVLQILAHLGVGHFLLIDPDIVEESNLNRLAGATPADIGSPKVIIAARTARQIQPGVSIATTQDTINRSSIALSLTNTDFVFGCTDSHGSRAILNQLAYQYLIPTIDMGVVIASHKGRITHIAGRTQMLAPGLACLICGNLLDSEQVRRDLLSEHERRADPYILGDAEPAPAVMSLNSTVASLATTMFLNATTKIPGTARFLNYDAIAGTVRPVASISHPSCIVCSSYGALGRAGEWPLPARMD